MNAAAECASLSEAAQRRMLRTPGEPLFYASWDHAVMVHYEADPAALQSCVPFELDLRNGRAFVSLVAFTLRRMRPRLGGRLGEWLFRPIASHEFLNVRTYVRHAGEPGIFFLAEWLSNPLSVRLGPRSFGLPYRFGHLRYAHTPEDGEMFGTVCANEGELEYRALISTTSFDPSEAGSQTEFLLERYTAFTCQGRRRRLFRVWHEPWTQAPIEIEVAVDDLLGSTGPWWRNAECVGANYSPGVEVWMGRPHRITDYFAPASSPSSAHRA